MARSLNRWTGIGNLGNDPEGRTTPGGAQVCNFRVACTETWKDKSGQKQERTEWVTIVAWQMTAELALKYLHKGSKVYIEGKLQTRSWDDKATGAKRYATEVLAEELLFLDGAPTGGNRGGQNSGHGGGHNAGGSDEFPDFNAPPNGVTPGAADDDLPF